MTDMNNLRAALELNQPLADIRRVDFRYRDEHCISIQDTVQRYGVPYRTLYRWLG